MGFGVAIVASFLSLLTIGLVSRRRGNARPWLENTAQKALGWGGLALLIVGVAVFTAGSQSAANDRQGNDILMVLGGAKYFDPTAGDTGQGWATFGLVIAGIGVVALVTLLAVKAIPQRGPVE